MLWRPDFQGLPKSIELIAVTNQTYLIEALCHLIGPWCKFGRDGGFGLHPFTGFGVSDPQSPGMKHESVDRDGLAGRFAVDGIAQKGVPEGAIMNSDLVGATGVKSAENQGGAIRCGVKEMEVGDRRFAGSRVADIHALAVDGVAGDVVEDGLMGFLGGRLCDAEVELGALALRKLRNKVFERGVGLGGDEAAGGVLIEAVNNAGSSVAPFRGELACAMMKESIDKGAIVVACRGVNDHAGSLVDEDDFLVLTKDGEWDILWLGLAGFFFGNGNRDGIAGLQGGARLYLGVIEKNVASFDQGLDT